MTAEPGVGRAHARVALAGNPSDGYGGAVLALELREFAADAVAEPSATSRSEPAVDLVDATIRRFAAECVPAAAPSTVRWRSSIPQSVGLGGSSAIVIATLRALCALHAVSLDGDALAALALAVETEELGIAAGPQDRVAQAFGGLTFMDFAQAPPRYQRLDPGLLPPLVVAWHPASAAPSGTVHGDLQRRYERGEPRVREGMNELAQAARAARDALRVGDLAQLGRCVDRSFDLRRTMVELDPRHVTMIEQARSAGASANYAGSGGAIVCLCPTEHHRRAVGEALGGNGCQLTSVGLVQAERRQ